MSGSSNLGRRGRGGSGSRKAGGGWKLRAAFGRHPLPASLLLVGFLGLILLLDHAVLGKDSIRLPRGEQRDTAFGVELADSLAGEGFEKERVLTLLGDPRLEILSTTLAYAIVYRESKADYSHFADADRLKRGRAFLKRKEAVLDKAEERFGVPREVTAAILLIESDFGNYRKLHRTANVFLSLLWADRPENFETLKSVVRRRLPDVDDETLRARAKKKGRWGYEQFKTLLRIAEREEMDLYSIEGSWAGAFGLPQFIPTSYWDYAVDGNGDARVRLDEEDDAIFSIGNYLKRFGWKNSLPLEGRRKALRRYNNSSLYVDTVLAVAEKFKQ